MRAPTRRTRDERGVSSVELVLYMPILMILILLTVQFSLYYLGRQAASAVARETARVARVTLDEAEARRVGDQHVRNIGQGILEDHQISIRRTPGDRVRVTVSGRAQEILPFGVPRVSQTVEGPIEQFVEAP